MVDIFYYLLNNIHLTIRWLIELAIIAIAIILTVRGAKRKKANIFSNRTLFELHHGMEAFNALLLFELLVVL